MDKESIINKNSDIVEWLNGLRFVPNHKFKKVIANARARTCITFIISFDYFEQLTSLDRKDYNEREGNILNYYYGELRKIKSNRESSDLFQQLTASHFHR